MHQRRTASVIRFLSSEGAKPIEIHRQMKSSMVMHVCHYSKCTSGLGSSRTALVLLTDSPRPGARVAALSAKGFFFLEVFMDFRSAGTLV